MTVNVLYLAHRIPYPPTKGDKLRAFRHIERLGHKHRVWCACFVDDPPDLQWVAPLGKYCEELIAIPLSRRRALLRGGLGVLSGGTVTESFYASGAMRRALAGLCERVQFNLVIGFSSSMGQYARTVPCGRRVLDLCDCDSRKWSDYSENTRWPRRLLYRVEASRLREIERAIMRTFDAVLIISDAEKKALCNRENLSNVQVVTNGVTLPALGSDCTTSRGRNSKEHHVLGFLGVMNYRPNVDGVCWFVDSIWPRILERYPTSELRIAGRNPTGRVRKLGGVKGVRVLGEIDDVWSEMRGWDVSVAPLRIARGVQNKVLEAMAAAKPVVLTPCAAEGIDARDGEHYLVAESSGAFVEQVCRLLGDGNLRSKVGSSARQFVETHHDWHEVLAKYEWLVTGVKERSVATSNVLTREHATGVATNDTCDFEHVVAADQALPN